ncbi:MAG TPA: hypothetical protein VG537_02780 [Candidatus Kapabacteria bacterium]|jgi:hypothetical protein|nr:hypothetical protein [Candidatus Kapabacteria bacterium]
MQAIKVTYTVQEDYSEHNKANINAVMSELRALNRPDIRYATFVENDGRTFTHFAVRKDAESFKLDSLESFQKFQAELKASNPEKPPMAAPLTLVGSSYDLF